MMMGLPCDKGGMSPDYRSAEYAGRGCMPDQIRKRFKRANLGSTSTIYGIIKLVAF